MLAYLMTMLSATTFPKVAGIATLSLFPLIVLGIFLSWYHGNPDIVAGLFVFWVFLMFAVFVAGAGITLLKD